MDISQHGLKSGLGGIMICSAGWFSSEWAHLTIATFKEKITTLKLDLGVPNFAIATQVFQNNDDFTSLSLCIWLPLGRTSTGGGTNIIEKTHPNSHFGVYNQFSCIGYLHFYQGS
jgi:hypothetical protein